LLKISCFKLDFKLGNKKNVLSRKKKNVTVELTQKRNTIIE